jgi:hypothetical protein
VAGAFLPRTTITYLTERDAWAAIANSERTPNAKVILGSDQLVCAEVQTKELRKIMTRKPIPCRGCQDWRMEVTDEFANPLYVIQVSAKLGR